MSQIKVLQKIIEVLVPVKAPSTTRARLRSGRAFPRGATKKK
jgi:hypothetical protein